MTPQFRVTFTHPVYAAGGVIVTEPLGMKGAKLNLTRNQDYHCVLETLNGSFVWFGDALTIILNTLNGEGPAAKLQVLFELTFDSVTFDTIFDGLLDLSMVQLLSSPSGEIYKVTVPILRNDFWSKFLNRRSTPVDLQATVDLDGNVRTLVDKITLPLPCQVIRQSFFVESWTSDFYDTMPGGQYGIIGFSGGVEKDEIKNRANLISGVSSTLPDPLFTVDGPGTLTIDTTIFINDTGSEPISGSQITGIDCYVDIDGTPHVMTITQLGTNPVDGRTRFTYSNNFFLIAGAMVRIYFKNSTGAPISFYQVQGWQSSISIVFDSTAADSQSQGYLIKDAAESIISKLVGADGVVTAGSLDTCTKQNFIAKGKHIRGNLLSDPSMAFTMTFDEWWKGFDPMYSLGLGPVNVFGVDKMEILTRESFYDPTPSIAIDDIPNLERSFNLARFYRTIKNGYQKWSVGQFTGIDDPQTTHTYVNGIFATIGKDLVDVSSFIAAALGIEQTRRAGKSPNVNWTFDEDILIINIKPDGGGGWLPEVGADWAAITNIFNAATRYNIRHTPARMFDRHRKWYEGCVDLPVPAAGVFKFSEGEGNLVMTSELGGGQCEYPGAPVVVAENENKATLGSYITRPEQFKIPEKALSWDDYKIVRNNTKQAIAISANSITDPGQYCGFIENFEYDFFNSKFTAVLTLGPPL